MVHRRKRRGSVAPYRHLPEDAIVLTAPQVELPRYTEPRPGKLSPAQVDTLVLAVDRGRTLRDVAAEFGISAERVRQLTRERSRPSLHAR